MNLLVVISIEFLAQDPLGLLDIGDVFPDAGSDESVLEPAIGSFNLASGLGRKRMDDLYIIGVRESISKDDGLEGQDMGPAGFLLNQNGIKEEPAIIIQGSDEIPFLLGRGCPEMMRGVMLNEFSDITG